MDLYFCYEHFLVLLRIKWQTCQGNLHLHDVEGLEHVHELGEKDGIN